MTAGRPSLAAVDDMPAESMSTDAERWRRSADGADDLLLLTPDQLCSMLQIKKSWLYGQVERGALPCLRLGKQLRFRRRDVRRYLDDVAQI